MTGCSGVAPHCGSDRSRLQRTSNSSFSLTGVCTPNACPPTPAPPCETCGRLDLSRPEAPMLDATSLPTSLDIFRIGNFATMIVGTERFMEVALRLELKGIRFLELPTR
ncbi:double-CXXCG motif protein [Myxococcus sp. Y35]|uniref:double-CXXCG motif protein n=1 Tax=Pseudomyxococcus flavus TaxID=3115648 RepID=UPI003CE828A4